MANYVFLMQFDNDTELSDEDTGRLRGISEIGSGFSMIGSVLTLSLLCFLPTKGDGLFITANMSVILLAAQISFIGAENTSYPDPIMCKIATAVIHYFFLGVHFASLAYAMHLWSKFGPRPLAVCRRRGFYMAMTWFVPFLVIIVTVIFRGKDFAKDTLCWLPIENNARLSFLVPLTVILLVNITLYGLIIKAQVQYDRKKDRPFKLIGRRVLFTSLSLIPSLSLQWILGYSVTFNSSKFFQYLYVILCSGQGMLLLVFHVLTNDQVRKSLCAKVNENGSEIPTPSMSESHEQNTATEEMPMPEHPRNKDDS